MPVAAPEPRHRCAISGRRRSRLPEQESDAARGGTTKSRRAGRGFVHGAARLSASALAGFLVRPIGPASTYSRAVLGAKGNLGGPGGPRKGSGRGKDRNLRRLNNQHFHSRPCSLWITARGDRERVPGRSAVAGPSTAHGPRRGREGRRGGFARDPVPGAARRSPGGAETTADRGVVWALPPT
jgi:hypothetical protein